MEFTADRKAVVYHVATGQRYERWPVDARDMIASGDYSTEPIEVTVSTGNPEERKTDESNPKNEDQNPLVALTGGYKVEKSGQWYKAFDPEGVQIGKSVRSEAEALALVPAIFHAGGAASGNAEHSPGVPLVVSPPIGE